MLQSHYRVHPLSVFFQVIILWDHETVAKVKEQVLWINLSSIPDGMQVPTGFLLNRLFPFQDPVQEFALRLGTYL